MDHQPQEIRGRGKNKRKWNNEEDAKLVDALLDMAKPHIESRIKTLKRDFNIVYDMLNGPNTSGFGMNPIKKCIVAEKAVWDSYLQSHPTHGIWQNKAFPMYDDLVIIFGKDRATGGNAEGPNDMMEEIEREDVNLNAGNDVEATTEIGLDDLDASFSPLQSPRSATVDKRKKRKRSVDNLMPMTDIKEAASIIGSEIAKASEIFGKAIGVDAEISEKRQRIDSEIRKIPDLAVLDVIKVVCRIAQSPELTDVFFSMTEEGREQLARAIISDQV
ncbi:retrotransposon protein [Striga asiatica]|uniref:Retrotransposon protein n=1 Tax=Striga asiatica TaxID=4170 RepID=A0A5A7RE41_STRAF|nr:retrotransposon protein [Striga asiatica]